MMKRVSKIGKVTQGRVKAKERYTRLTQEQILLRVIPEPGFTF